MLLVDAYNVLHVTGVLPPESAGMDVPDLARAVAEGRWGRGGRAAKLVCDGRRPPGAPLRLGAVQIVYAGPGRDADGLIERLLHRDSAPGRITVVSSDRRLRAAARRRKADWISSEAFLRQVAADLGSGRPRPAAGDGRPEVPLSGAAVELWKREFGFEEPAGGAGVVPPAPSAGATRDGAPEFDVDLRSALEEWGPEWDAVDLDMARWLTEDHPEFRRRSEGGRGARSRRGRSR